MIDLDTNTAYISSLTSSKGDQLKWCKDNIWYKADCNGYEGLSEYVTSRLLEKSSLKSNEYVRYDLEQIKYKDRIFKGCKAKNFLNKNNQLITL